MKSKEMEQIEAAIVATREEMQQLLKKRDALCSFEPKTDGGKQAKVHAVSEIDQAHEEGKSKIRSYEEALEVATVRFLASEVKAKAVSTSASA